MGREPRGIERVCRLNKGRWISSQLGSFGSAEAFLSDFKARPAVSLPRPGDKENKREKEGLFSRGRGYGYRYPRAIVAPKYVASESKPMSRTLESR